MTPQAVEAAAACPLVSVIVPTYNHASFLPETLRSIAAQTLEAWECIVVDDGSTDNTAGVFDAVTAGDKRFIYYSQENRGLAAARNRGLGLSRGTYVQFLDADDLILPDKLRRQTAFLDSRPGVGICVSWYHPFESETGRSLPPFWPEMLSENPLHDFLFRWERGLCIPIHAALFRATLWPHKVAFDEALRAKEDWAMWIDLALRAARFELLDEDLALYRIHGRNMFQSGVEMSIAFAQAAMTVVGRLPESLQRRFIKETTSHVRRDVTKRLAALERENQTLITDGDALRRRLARASRAADEVRREPVAEGSSTFAACTIVARNYLPQASVLIRSFLQHHPGANVYLLVVDGHPEEGSVPDGVQLIPPDQLPIAYLSELSFKYDVVGLCTALKPSVLRFLLDRGEERVVFFDPDILITRTLSDLGAALEMPGVLLTPHLLFPLPPDGREPSEPRILSTGVFNLGFIGISACEEVREFLAWWELRVRDGCRIDAAHGFFVDQKWVDLAPTMFTCVRLIRDETYNVAYWNLDSRRISRDPDGSWLVNGRPLSFFHFSGIDFAGLGFLPGRQNRYVLREGDPLRLLIASYVRLLHQNGYAAPPDENYAFAQFENGAPVDRFFRETFVALPANERSRFRSPFSAGEGSFFQWAVTPDDAIGGLTPYAMTIYRLRPDVMAAYPEVTSGNTEGYLNWLRHQGVREMNFQLRFVGSPIGPEGQPVDESLNESQGNESQ
jgi:glycosyltransferase involved in cell wall biosynthesis